MTTQKIKTLGTLSAKFNHNHRKIEVSNADPTLYHKNEALITSLDENGETINYSETWKKRFEELPYYHDHKLRSNAVLAIEVVTTFSREDNIDLESWKKENVEWLNKTFNIAGDGKNNVVDVIYHADEPGNVHCHAIVIPVDEHCRLNASRFLDGQRALSAMQSDYAKSMKQFGLERGLENGQAKHEDIKKYYADLNNAIKVPEPEREETAFEYRDRIFEELQTLQAAALRERREKQRETERRLAEGRKKHEQILKEKYETFHKDKESVVSELKLQNKEAIQMIKEKKVEIQKMENKLSALQKKCEETQSQISESIENAKKIEFFDTLQKQLSILKSQDPKQAEQFLNIMKNMSTLTLGKEEQIK